MKLPPFMQGVWRFCYPTRIPKPDRSGPYMDRLQLIETPWFGVRLHRIYAADDDRHLHDHPFDFASFLLWGSYDEETMPGTTRASSLTEGLRSTIRRRVRWFNARRAQTPHRITRLFSRSVVTLVFTNGRKRASWGYYTDRGWVYYRTYQARNGLPGAVPVRSELTPIQPSGRSDA